MINCEAYLTKEHLKSKQYTMYKLAALLLVVTTVVCSAQTAPSHPIWPDGFE